MKIKLPILVIGVLSGLAFAACKTSKSSSAKNIYPSFFKVGHRGTRGLMPENTIPSMIKAIQVGANTIEVDVHLTKDGQVIVYHDASINPDYTTMPDGSEIPKEERKKYSFYQMNYEDVRPFVVGKKEYPAFPQQERIATYAPLLSELIDSVENFTKGSRLEPVYYLVEVKYSDKADSTQQPSPEYFMSKMMEVLDGKKLGHRLIVQSFDVRPLQVLHRTHPQLKLGFLTGDRNKTFEENLEKLGFIPAFYNPNYLLVSPELVRKCHEKQIMIEPWTVNSLQEMKTLKSMGVDGIITDYPNLFAQL